VKKILNYTENNDICLWGLFYCRILYTDSGLPGRIPSLSV